jgi:hypothetical protein
MLGRVVTRVKLRATRHHYSLEHFAVCFATLEEHQDPAKNMQDPVYAGRTANGPVKLTVPASFGRMSDPVSLRSRDERRFAADPAGEASSI